MSFYESLSKVLQGMNRTDEYEKLITEYAKYSNGIQKEVYLHPMDVDGNKAHLIPLSDLHLGHMNFNTEKLTAFARYILETPDTYTILLGDQGETATRTSVGMGMFDETIHVREQIDLLYEIFKPIAAAGKLWGIHPGNHEYRIPKEVGICPAELLAMRLNVPYLGFQGYHVLQVRNQNTGDSQTYTMMTYHGVGGGSTIGSLVNASQRGDKVCPNCDLYLSGHTHAKNMSTSTVFNIDPVTCQLVPHTRYYVICGSFLEYWGSYAEMKLLAPQSTGAPLISFGADQKDIRVIMGR
jgi:hypothetical protein